MRQTIAIAAVAFAVSGAASAAEFAILIWEPAEEHALRHATGPATDAYWADYGAWAGAMAEAGIVRGGAPVKAEGAMLGDAPTGGPTLGGLTLGGWMLIDAADLDAAKGWAARSPALARGGAVDVRPLDVNPLM